MNTKSLNYIKQVVLYFDHMELYSTQVRSPFDWSFRDREAYVRLSLTTNPPWPDSIIRQNTFCNACLNITRDRRSSEFTRVRQRNAYYDFISYIFEYSSIPDRRVRPIKFFHATTVVTAWAALGAIESFGGRLSLSSSTIAVLSEVNRILFADNMYVIYLLLFTKTLNFPFAFVNNNPSVVNPQEITPFEFDLQMVRFEQSIVGSYISSNRDRFDSTVISEINNSLNPDGPIMRSVSFITGGIARESMNMARTNLKVLDLNFLNYKHRTAIGFATIHIFHKKTNNYKEYLKRIGYIE